MIVEFEYAESWRNLGQVRRLEIYLSDLKFLSYCEGRIKQTATPAGRGGKSLVSDKSREVEDACSV